MDKTLTLKMNDFNAPVQHVHPPPNMPMSFSYIPPSSCTFLGFCKYAEVCKLAMGHLGTFGAYELDDGSVDACHGARGD